MDIANTHCVYKSFSTLTPQARRNDAKKVIETAAAKFGEVSWGKAQAV
jgi:hypothetical protein